MIRAWLRKLFKSQYVAYLEAELERTRLERNQSLDALLKSRNLPTLTPAEPKALPRTFGKPLPSQHIRRMERLTMPKDTPDA